MRRMRIVLAALFFVFGTCGPSDPNVPEPETCSMGPPTRGDGGALATRAVLVGSGEGASFAPYTDGSEVRLVHGFQGGEMITPMVRVEAAGSTAADACWVVEVEHELTDGTSVEPGPTLNLRFRRTGDFFEAGPLNDFLGFDPSQLAGKMLRYTVTVRGDDFEATTTIVLTIVNP